jgi:hypothetical protein
VKAPSLSYWQALALFIPGEMGRMSTVRDCPAHIFATHVRRAAQTAKDPQKCTAALDGLDFRHCVDKWAALCALHQHQARLPCAPTWIDARDLAHGML